MRRRHQALSVQPLGGTVELVHVALLLSVFEGQLKKRPNLWKVREEDASLRRSEVRA